MADFIENLFEATQTIVDKAISDLQFDKTVKAVIIDDSDASSGVYTVLEGTATYDAYTENTSFVKDDVVYVTIPNSDYSQQKIITGKVVTKTEPFIVNNALTSYLDITDNLIIDTNNTGKENISQDIFSYSGGNNKPQKNNFYLVKNINQYQ